MGRFIKFGLCTKIIHQENETKQIKKYYSNFDNFIIDFEKQTNIDTKIYNFSEINNCFVLTIKNEFLMADTLIVFLKNFFSTIYEGEKLRIYCDDIYEDIKNKGSVYDLIEFSKEKPHQNFQFSCSEHNMRLPFSTYITIEYEYITLFFNGKVHMECYNELFSYIEKLIRAQHNYPQSGAIKIFLD
jgi:hypothetical protein